MRPTQPSPRRCIPLVALPAALLALGLAPAALAEDEPPRDPAAEGPAATEPSPAEEAVPLALELAQGDRFRFLVESEERRVISQGDAELVIAESASEELAWEVLEVHENGNVDVKVTFAKIAGRAERPDVGVVTYDSADPDAAPDLAAGKVVADAKLARAGRSFEVTLSPTGKVVEVRGLGELAQAEFDADRAAAERRGQDGTDADAGAAPAEGDAAVVEQRLRHDVAEQLPVQCDLESLSRGSEWSQDSELPEPGLGVLKIARANRVEEITDDTIAVRSDFAFELVPADGSSAALENGTGHARSVVSREDGLPVSATSELEARFTDDSGAEPVSVVHTIRRTLTRLPVEEPSAEPAEAPQAK